MELEKAIEIKVTWKMDGYPPPGADQIDADQMSIEALKAVKECRASHMFCPGLLMPGETEE